MPPLRVLFLADSHLGFDHPLSPRVRRRRRGPDFLANHRRALEPALNGEMDLVVHGGDVFHRSRPHSTLVAQAFEPLIEVAERSVPVFIVPGNHERSRIPHVRFASHPLIHVFDRPRTFQVPVADRRVALLGFPYERDVVRRRFPELIAATGWRAGAADVSLLCVHHCFEGATVGPADFTFRRGPDVIRCRDIPEGLTAVLTGHVHRHQVLTRDLDGHLLPAPVLYPGSVERTAYAEMGEEKGYLVLEIDDGAPHEPRPGSGDGPSPAAPTLRWTFRPLPARPMVAADLRAAGLGSRELRARIATVLAEAPPEAVLRLRLEGRIADDAHGVLSAEALRSLVPPDMNVDVVLADEPRRRRTRRRAARPAPGESGAYPAFL